MSSLPKIPYDVETKVIRHLGPGRAWQRTVTLPTSGKFVEESHYATVEDHFPNNRLFPESETEKIEDHLNRSLAIYQKYDPSASLDKLYRNYWNQVWTPPEGGKHGQGSVGNLRPNVEEEMWFITMMWASSSEKPKPGTKFLLSANNRYAVVVAGYETGPGSESFLGGVTREVHAWLGTNNSSQLTLEYLRDQSVPIGPVELEGNETPSYRVTASSLNIRRDPSLNSDIIGSLSNNQVIYDAAKQTDSDQRTWMKVTLPNLSGWVSMRYLEPIQPEKKRYRVTATLLNVRDRPSIQNSTILGTLRRDELVELQDDNSAAYWLNIQQINGNLAGYASRKYLEQIGIVSQDFPWFAIALVEEGVREKAGSGDNPRIVEYLQSTTLSEPSASNDETPWCSAFVNWCVEKAGYAGTDSAWAKSWLNWGQPLSTPQKGCIVVFERRMSNGQIGGHVGFYISETSETVKVFGGNQSDSVKYSHYPKDGYLGRTKYRLLGYRTI
ncbi:MAG: TIGR02594 family protein [Microcystaceae cyanobacterium]